MTSVAILAHITSPSDLYLHTNVTFNSPYPLDQWCRMSTINDTVHVLFAATNETLKLQGQLETNDGIRYKKVSLQHTNAHFLLPRNL